MFRKNIYMNMAVVYHLSIWDVIKKDNIASIQYFLCQHLSRFYQNIISRFFEPHVESYFI